LCTVYRSGPFPGTPPFRPASYQRAFDNAVRVRDEIRRTARPGKTARAMMDE